MNNLAHWETWSPWVIAEPDAAVKVSKDGKYHEWEGKIIGSGKETYLVFSSVSYLNSLKEWLSNK